MKKILFVLAIVCSSMCVSAQMYVGGSLWFNQTKTEDSDYKRTEVNILPEIGYTINDKWAIGTTVGFYQDKREQDDYADVKNKHFSISPYARYSFLRKNIFSLFVDGGPNIKFGKFTDYNSPDPDWTTTLGLGISPGVSVKVCDKIILLAHLGTLRYDHSDDYESFDFNLRNSLYFGVFYSF